MHDDQRFSGGVIVGMIVMWIFLAAYGPGGCLRHAENPMAESGAYED